MTYIDNYAILAKRRYASGYYCVSSYKTLKTAKTNYAKMTNTMKNKPHDRLMLVARSSEKEIIKIYERED